jgi:hypothetical protein
MIFAIDERDIADLQEILKRASDKQEALKSALEGTILKCIK